MSQAQQAMAKRTHVTFGKAYMRLLKAAAVKDQDKLFTHAAVLGAGRPATLAKLPPEKLCEVIVAKLAKVPRSMWPKNATCLHLPASTSAPATQH